MPSAGFEPAIPAIKRMYTCVLERMAIEIGQSVAYPGILFGGGSTNSVEDRENGDLGAVAP